MPDVQTDVRIHYRLVGNGPPVVWHTGGCGDGRMWELGGYLAGVPGFTHTVLDHRGRGSSEAPVDMSGHHMARYVADVVAVLDHAGFDQAAFVGYSFGCAPQTSWLSPVPSRPRSPGRTCGPRLPPWRRRSCSCSDATTTAIHWPNGLSGPCPTLTS